MTSSPQLAYLTTREAAGRLGVSVRTVQLWVESGILDAWKTSGGHRRISHESVARQLRRQGNPVVEEKVAVANAAVEGLAGAGKRPLKLVVVEDDPIYLRLYEGKIARWSLPVDLQLAEDGYQGLLLIGQMAPDMVITDLRMPGMDGFRLLRAILSDPLLRDTEVVAVSSLEPETWEKYGGLPPGVTFFPKPPPFDQIQRLAEDLVQRRGLSLS